MVDVPSYRSARAVVRYPAIVFHPDVMADPETAESAPCISAASLSRRRRV